MSEPVSKSNKEIPIVGIAGGSGAGKTTTADKIMEGIGVERSVVQIILSTIKEQLNE